MLRAVLVSACLVALFRVPNAVASLRPALAPGDAAPALAATALGDSTATKVRWEAASLSVVNFWATWCAPCRSEMPVLEALRREHADGRLAVYGVVIDAAADDAVAAFASELGIGYPILRGSVELSDLWGGIGLMPTTFLVDSKGVVRRRYVGATAETIARLKADVGTLLARVSRAAESKPAAAPAPPR